MECRFWILLAILACVVASAAPCVVAFPYAGNLDLRARTSIGNLKAQSGVDMPVSYGAVIVPEKKSAARAMLLSALLPGLGEIYASGRRGYISGSAMAATDLFSMWRYFDNTRDGDSRKRQYQDFAKMNYSRDTWYTYVHDEIAVENDLLGSAYCDPASPEWDDDKCHAIIYRVLPLSKADDATFYEQIALDNRYIFGWKDWVAPTGEDIWPDWDPDGDLPANVSRQSPLREEYRRMREDANDSYGKAERYAWIMVIGRVVSMVDAAILVKLRNRDLAAIGINPRLSFKVKFRSNPNFKVSLKLRF